MATVLTVLAMITHFVAFHQRCSVLPFLGLCEHFHVVVSMGSRQKLVVTMRSHKCRKLILLGSGDRGSKHSKGSSGKAR